MPPAFQDLQVSLLEHLILYSHVGATCYPSCLVLFLRSIKHTSLSPLYLTFHIVLCISQRVASNSKLLLSLDWSDVAAVLVLPIFRYPIELHIGQWGTTALFVDLVSSFEQNFDIKRLLGDGKLRLIHGPIKGLP